MAQNREKRWAGRTDGTPWMQKALTGLIHHVGLGLPYGVMAVVVPFYMLFRHQAYLATYRFFRRRLIYGRWKAFWSVYRNHYVFGQVILDRFAVYAGKRFRIEAEGRELFENLARQPGGFMQLSAHVGNYELAGYSLVSTHKRFHVLAYAGETETVMRSRARVLAQNNLNLIPVKAAEAYDLSHVFLLRNALQAGDIVGMSGDRAVGSSKTIPCRFLGEEAAFPAGPFALAVQNDVPVQAVFVMKASRSGYRVIVKPLTVDGIAALSKPERMRALAAGFAAELEAVVRRYPTQWFNYYDFWNV